MNYVCDNSIVLFVLLCKVYSLDCSLNLGLEKKKELFLTPCTITKYTHTYTVKLLGHLNRP